MCNFWRGNIFILTECVLSKNITRTTAAVEILYGVMEERKEKYGKDRIRMRFKIELSILIFLLFFLKNKLTVDDIHSKMLIKLKFVCLNFRLGSTRKNII